MANLKIIAANNATSVLSAGISATATSLVVASGTGAIFPAPTSGSTYFKLTLVDATTGESNEIVHVTAVSGDTFTIVRGQEGTTTRAWSTNDIATNMITAGTIGVMGQLNTAEFQAAVQGRLVNIQVFASAGTFTYTKTAGTVFAEIEVVGAGGGATGCQGVNTNTVVSGAGGGAGGTTRGIRTLPNATYSLIVGAGGTGGTGLAPGTDGGSSSFGTLVATGGRGGTLGSTSSSGGEGGNGSGGVENLIGGMGNDGQFNGFLFNGSGGASSKGGGGRSGNPSGNDGHAAGSGGGGPYDIPFSGTPRKGGDGKDGIIIIREYA